MSIAIFLLSSACFLTLNLYFLVIFQLNFLVAVISCQYIADVLYAIRDDIECQHMIAQMLRAKEKDTYLVELSCCADFDRKNW